MNFQGFMYLDIENPLVAWNSYRGVLLSQELVQQGVSTELCPALSMTISKIFMDRNWDRYQFEMTLEIIRKAHFPDRTSRLTGMYVFDDLECAFSAARDEAWSGHIDRKNLTEVGVSAASNTTRLDANWINWMLTTRQSGNQNWREGVRPYWEGVSCPHYRDSIWEVLVHGAVTIWGTEIRDHAYKVTKEYSPKSVALLELSRLAATLGSDLGHINALFTNNDGRPLISFYIDMRDATNQAYLDKLNEYTSKNPSLVNHIDLAVGGAMFRTPNFLAYSYAFHE